MEEGRTDGLDSDVQTFVDVGEMRNDEDEGDDAARRKARRRSRDGALMISMMWSIRLGGRYRCRLQLRQRVVGPVCASTQPVDGPELGCRDADSLKLNVAQKRVAINSQMKQQGRLCSIRDSTRLKLLEVFIGVRKGRKNVHDTRQGMTS